MRTMTRLLGRTVLGPLVLGLAALGVFALPGSALASTSSTRVIGHVYLDGNTAGANTVAAYNRAPDGSLTPAPGSPFAVGGAGLGKGLGSQGSIQLADQGRYLLAVDAGSNQISVLQTNQDGSLTRVPGSPVSSGGVEPVSIAVHDHLVYVANDGDATHSANYTGFFLTGFGQLVPLPHSTVNAPGAANDLGDVLFNGNGTKLVGTEVASSLIDSFRVDGLGYLHAAPGSPYAGQGLGAFGSEFRPTNPDQLFVSNPHNVGNDVGTVSAFDVANDGDFQVAACEHAVRIAANIVGCYRRNAIQRPRDRTTVGMAGKCGLPPALTGDFVRAGRGAAQQRNDLSANDLDIGGVKARRVERKPQVLERFVAIFRKRTERPA